LSLESVPKQIACNAEGAIFLLENGTAWLFDAHFDANIQFEIPDVEEVVQIACNQTHALVLVKSGKLFK
jgi:hypothetical protein